MCDKSKLYCIIRFREIFVNGTNIWQYFKVNDLLKLPPNNNHKIIRNHPVFAKCLRDNPRSRSYFGPLARLRHLLNKIFLSFLINLIFPFECNILYIILTPRADFFSEKVEFKSRICRNWFLKKINFNIDLSKILTNRTMNFP